MTRASQEDQELLRIARERFQLAADAEREIRAEAKKDLQFLAGDQWDTEERTAREDNNRPALTINKLPQFVDQVVNEQRRSRAGASVTPVGQGADRETGDICEGMIRHIDYASHAEVAYDTAFEYSASCGFGYWRYLTEYVDDESFDQEIRVEAIPDPFGVYLDPGAIKSDRSDMNWAFIVSTITREEFKRRWPQSETVSADFFDLAGNAAPDWIRDDGIRIAEYWVIERTKRTLCLYSDGSTRYKDEKPGPRAQGPQKRVRGRAAESNEPPISESDGAPAEGAIAAEPTIVKERPVEERQIRQYIINGAEVLERSDWAGKWIPIVPVFGKQLMVDGKRKLFSLIRFARDPQALYNYYKTAQAEAVGLSPKAPYIGYVGQFRTKAGDWAMANRVPFAYLEVDPVTVGGQPAPLPQRNTYEPPIQALSVGAMQASDDIKATTGIFDPSLGANKGDLSGRAINALQNEGDTSNFHLVDNLTRSLWHGYRILLDLLPKIYDASRAVRIIRPDEQSELVLINQIFADPKTGKPKQYDVTLGRYDVVMSVGPNYQTRREEARDRLGDLAKADPASLPQWADLYVRQLDMGPLGDEIADRLTPPQFRQQQGQPNPQAMQQALQQLSQQHDQLVNQIHQLSHVIETKQIETSAAERLKAMEVWRDLRIAEIKIGSSAAMADADREAKRLASVFDRAHEAALASVSQPAPQQTPQQQPAAPAQLPVAA